MTRTLTTLICSLILAVSATAHAKTFKIATVAPDGTAWMKEMKKGAQEIATRTEGRVKFRFYPGGVMGSDRAILRKMRIGQLHGGAITGGGLAETYPDANIYSLPLAFQSLAEVDYVRQHMDQQLIDNLREEGFVSFGFSEGGFAYLMSHQPIAGITDLSGKKVWTPDGDKISQAAFEAVGVSPVPLLLTDVLTGLQTGTVDTVAISAVGAIALQWHTKVKYVTDIPLMYLYGTLIMNRKDFDKLSAGDQVIVREVMSKVFERLDEITREDNNKAYAALENQGIQFVAPSTTDQQQWQSSVVTAVDQLVQRGVVSKPVTEAFYKHLSDYRNGQQQASHAP